MLFKTNVELKCHVRIHTGAKPHSCRHCSERFTRLRKLKQHLLKSHNAGTWLVCHICLKMFSCSDHLKVHVRRHEDVKPYVCIDCSKRFYTASELTKHQLKHSDFRRFCCSLCDSMFKHKWSVVNHFKKCSSVHGQHPLVNKLMTCC